MRLLILNAGSSSLKYSVIETLDERVSVQGQSSGQPNVRGILDDVRSKLAARGTGDVERVVHRVVHGGTRFTQAVRITHAVRADLNELTELAPLHNPPSLAIIDASMELMPDVPHLAVFDTAFHTTLPPQAYTYPLPHEWNERWGLRRFGFHGLSHAYGAQRAAQMLNRPQDGTRVIVAHLGNGSSVTAVSNGRSLDTSMGFTPLEGLMMGTRSGTIDPGLLLHLQLRLGISAEALQHSLNHSSGLLGVSGVSSDMREVAEAAGRGDDRARLAIAIFVHRARQAIGAAAVTLGAVDALVFTGGIGEHSAEVRAAVSDGLSCLGLEIDVDANAAATPDAFVSKRASRSAILVITAREDVMMARAVSARGTAE
jgi:acetate kinase